MGDSSYQLSIKGTETILEQMKFSVCKILNVENKGTGFFCNIPLENKFIKVLITNNHVIGDKDLFEGNSIKLSLNDDKIQIKIVLRSSRKMFTNKELDITFIEIIEEDLLKYINFLEIDEMIYINEDFINEYYCKKQIYTLHYPKSECLNVSYGIFKEKKQEEIYHYCNTEEGSSGGPILLLKTLKVIGIHKASNKAQDLNIGTFIKYAIDQFIHFLKKQIQENKTLSIIKKTNNKTNTKSPRTSIKHIKSKKEDLNDLKINIYKSKFYQISPSPSRKSGKIGNTIYKSNNSKFSSIYKSSINIIKGNNVEKNNIILYHKKSVPKINANQIPNFKTKNQNNNNFSNYKEELLIDRDNDFRYSENMKLRYSNFNTFNLDYMNDNNFNSRNNNNMNKYNANLKDKNNHFKYHSNINNINKYLYNNNMKNYNNIMNSKENINNDDNIYNKTYT